jgi:preprotein translocase subunit SecD
MSLLLCVGCTGNDDTVSLELRMVELEPADSLTRLTMAVWGGEWTYWAHPEVLLTEHDVREAHVVEQKGSPAIVIVFADEARNKLREFTRDNIGRRLGVIIDGHLVCTAEIEEPNQNGVVIVTGQFLEPAAIRTSKALSRRQA